MPDPIVRERMEALPDLVNTDAALVRRGRFLTTTFLLAVGATSIGWTATAAIAWGGSTPRAVRSTS